MNLATVSSTSRNREVGMRKVLGAHRWQLISQFLGESLLISVIALVFALVLTQLILPVFNGLSGKELSIDLLEIQFLIKITGITILVGLFSGSYPAFFLSSFTPDAVFRGKSRKGPAGSLVRKGLVIAQFAISAIFIIGTLIVNRQMNYVQKKDLGFEKERKIVLPFGDPRARQIYLTFKQELTHIPEVYSSAGAITVPGGLINVGPIQPEGRPEGENVLIDQIFVDHDFISTLGIELTGGRDFSVEYPADTMTAFIINEAAANHFEWDDDPIGKQINIGNFKQGRVIGVVQDFHVKSLHQRIEPLLLHIAPDPDLYHYFVIRISGENISKTIADIEACWYRVYPQDPFIYSFLDEDFDSLYIQEELRGQIFSSFSILAIIIACLGLFGLASYTAEIRTREIGIRKVFGAEVRSIISMLSWDFTRLILFANIVAWPIAYLFLRNWLQNFAYRTNIPLWIYFLAAAISMVIALLTVLFQAARAATRNPADSLRYE
jgi:putative ABC transport system permease protein